MAGTLRSIKTFLEKLTLKTYNGVLTTSAALCILPFEGNSIPRGVRKTKKNHKKRKAGNSNPSPSSNEDGAPGDFELLAGNSNVMKWFGIEDEDWNYKAHDSRG